MYASKRVHTDNQSGIMANTWCVYLLVDTAPNRYWQEYRGTYIYISNQMWTQRKSDILLSHMMAVPY